MRKHDLFSYPRKPQTIETVISSAAPSFPVLDPCQNCPSIKVPLAPFACRVPAQWMRWNDSVGLSHKVAPHWPMVYCCFIGCK